MSHTEEAGGLLQRYRTAQLADAVEFFRRHKSEWLPQHRGQFVLIGKQTFGGFYPTYDAALRAATTMFGFVAPFLIEEVRDRNP